MTMIGQSLENMNNITLNANTFNTSVANAHAIVKTQNQLVPIQTQ
jgi:hypothetical protein